LQSSIEEVPVPRKLVTCPETAHLELIDFELHPLGILIRACTRFAPSCLPDCERICAARMDRRSRDTSRPPLLAVTDEDQASTHLVSIRLR
jgi:hypothetical protein